MNKFLAAIFLLITLKAFPQNSSLIDNAGFLSSHFIQDPLFNTNYSYNSTIMAYGDAYLTSNAINQSFYQDVLNYGYIDDDTKNNISNSLKALNTVDFNYNLSLAYRKKADSLFGCPHGNLFITISTRSLSSARFSNDAFNLIFFGNVQYAGKTAYLTGSSASLIYFNQLRIGWNGTKQQKNNSSISFGAAVSLLQGRNNFNLTTPAATLYTEPYGEYINVNYDIAYKTSDTTSSNIATFNGGGLSFDGFVQKKFSSTFSITLSASDVGFIAWGKNSLQTNADTGIHFTGYNAGDLFTLTDTAFNKINKDSILKLLGIREHKQSYITSLPFHFELSATKLITSWNAALSVGVVYWNYNPGQFIAYARFNHMFNKYFYGGVTADVNSIGSFEGGLDAGLQLNHFTLSASAGNLFENFVPQISTSATLQISAGYSF